jgi:segregation and condensation protein A
VTFQTFVPSTSKYQIATDIYSGPLDLLLQLIEKAELDITRLSLAKVTDQYLQHLQSLAVRDPIEVSAFLVMAARLVLIKSLVLLPRPETLSTLPEEDPGEILARQLITYKRFKEIALVLRERESKGLRTYLRMAPQPRIAGKWIPEDLNINELAQVYQNLLTAVVKLHPLKEAVSITAITLRQKIDEIVSILQTTNQSTFNALLKNKHTRMEIIVTFLALLELIKHHSILALQENPFEDIHLEKIGDLQVDIETEL